MIDPTYAFAITLVVGALCTWGHVGSITIDRISGDAKSEGVVFPLTLIEDFRLRLIVVPVVVLVFAVCFGIWGDAGQAGCSGLEVPPNRDGLISRSEAERLATERFAIPAPGVSGTEIERVWASCLTTLRSYERDLRKYDGWINPEFFQADAPVWIVEVKGITRPAGLSEGNGIGPYT